MKRWCVIAYRYVGGMEIFGPYSVRGVAATDAAVLVALDEFEAAYVIDLTDPAYMPRGK